MAKILLEDQTSSHSAHHRQVLEWQEGVPMTVRDLITERVSLEYDNFNDGREDSANHLVHLPAAAAFPKEKVVERAIEGFRQGAYFILVDNTQLTNLGEAIRLTPQSRVIFLKLVPLQGG